jgi:hypothetical protein
MWPIALNDAELVLVCCDFDALFLDRSVVGPSYSCHSSEAASLEPTGTSPRVTRSGSQS